MTGDRAPIRHCGVQPMAARSAVPPVSGAVSAVALR